MLHTYTNTIQTNTSHTHTHKTSHTPTHDTSTHTNISHTRDNTSHTHISTHPKIPHVPTHVHAHPNLSDISIHLTHPNISQTPIHHTHSHTPNTWHTCMRARAHAHTQTHIKGQELHMVAHTCNLSTWVVETEDQDFSHLWIHGRFKARLSYTELMFKIRCSKG